MRKTSSQQRPATSALDLLRQLNAAVPDAVRWRHWIVGVDSIGRITLPVEVRLAGEPQRSVRVVSRGLALIVRQEGLGALRQLDQRGRLTLPAWLRRAVGPAGVVLVSASVPEVSMVAVTPTGLLDAVIDRLAEEVG